MIVLMRPQYAPVYNNDLSLLTYIVIDISEVFPFFPKSASGCVTLVRRSLTSPFIHVVSNTAALVVCQRGISSNSLLGG